MTFQARKCAGFHIHKRWCVYMTTCDGLPDILIQTDHATRASAQREADRLNNKE